MLLLSCFALLSGSPPRAPKSGRSPPPKSSLPSEAVALAERGVAALRDGYESEAVAAFEAALDIAPDHAPTLTNLGLAWESIGLPLQAMECYSRAVAADSNFASAYKFMGILLYEQLGEHEMGEQALRTALELQPQRADLWNQLGRLLQSRGSLDESRDALETAVALSPESVDYYRNLATVQRGTGEFKAALATLHAARAATEASAAQFAAAAAADQTASDEAADHAADLAADLAEAMEDSIRLRALGDFEAANERLRAAAARSATAAPPPATGEQALAYAPPLLLLRASSAAEGEGEGEGGGESEGGDHAAFATSTASASTTSTAASMRDGSMRDGGSSTADDDRGRIQNFGRVVETAEESALPPRTPRGWCDRLCAIHRTPIATEEECEWVIAEANAHAESRSGWSQDGHHDAHPTTDIVVSESASLLQWLQRKLHAEIAPSLCAQFGLRAEEVWLEDAFIIKCALAPCHPRMLLLLAFSLAG